QIGGAPEERERRDEHAAVANRNQLRHPCLCLLLEQAHRIGTPKRSGPLAVNTPRHVGTLGLPARRPVLRREVLSPANRSRPTGTLLLCLTGGHEPISPALFLGCRVEAAVRDDVRSTRGAAPPCVEWGPLEAFSRWWRACRNSAPPSG